MGNYLEPGRLEDVIRLIQVTGLRKNYQSTAQATMNDLGEPEVAQRRWIDVAEQHPEFFRVVASAEDRTQHSISLLARHYYEVEKVVENKVKKTRPPVPWT